CTGAVVTGIAVLDVLDDEQTRGLVIQLFGRGGADLLAQRATAGADAFGFGEGVVEAGAPQVGGQGPAAVATPLGRRLRGGGRIGFVPHNVVFFSTYLPGTPRNKKGLPGEGLRGVCRGVPVQTGGR